MTFQRLIINNVSPVGDLFRYVLLRIISMCKCDQKEPKFRRKYRENAQALTRYFGKFVSHKKQILKFDRFKSHRSLLKILEPVEMERCLEFLAAAGVVDPFEHLMQMHTDGISFKELSRIAKKRFRLAG